MWTGGGRARPRSSWGCGVDKLTLAGMVFHAFHGVHDEEARLGQRFEVDLDMILDATRPGRTDLLADAVDYGRVYQVVMQVVTGERFHLIEALATAIARAVLREFPLPAVTVRVRKPQAPIKGIFGTVEIEIARERAWLEQEQHD